MCEDLAALSIREAAMAYVEIGIVRREGLKAESTPAGQGRYDATVAQLYCILCKHRHRVSSYAVCE